MLRWNRYRISILEFRGRISNIEDKRYHLILYTCFILCFKKILNRCFQIRFISILFSKVSCEYNQVNILIRQLCIYIIRLNFFFDNVYSKYDPVLTWPCIRNIYWKFYFFNFCVSKVSSIKLREV